MPTGRLAPHDPQNPFETIAAAFRTVAKRTEMLRQSMLTPTHPIYPDEPDDAVEGQIAFFGNTLKYYRDGAWHEISSGSSYPGTFEVFMPFSNGADTDGINLQETKAAPALVADQSTFTIGTTMAALDTAWHLAFLVINNSIHTLEFGPTDGQLSVQDVADPSSIALYSIVNSTGPAAPGGAMYAEVGALTSGTGELDISSPLTPTFLAAKVYAVTWAGSVTAS